MNEHDIDNLPESTCEFVRRLSEIGLDRTRIFGFFVMLGFYAGGPNTLEKIDKIFAKLNLYLPVDRSKNIDEVVGDVYPGYDGQINEFCYRSGVQLTFRKIQIPGSSETVSIVCPKDEGLLSTSVKSIDKLADAAQLYDSFLLSLGRFSIKNEMSLLEAYTCGIFQIQLHALSDTKGAMQFATLVQSCLPLVYSRCFKALIEGQTEYFLGLELPQIALLELMQPMPDDYAQQMWGFQSGLLYRDQTLIKGVNRLTVHDWHAWILENARNFDTKYPTQLIPFSRSNISLSDVPKWWLGVESFNNCDAYIEKVWGYSATSLSSDVETLEYKALLLHLVYASLTSAREVVN